jgi:hypothetical protein
MVLRAGRTHRGVLTGRLLLAVIVPTLSHPAISMDELVFSRGGTSRTLTRPLLATLWFDV